MTPGKCEENVRMSSGWRQGTSGLSYRARNASGYVKEASGWRQDGVRKGQNGVRQALEVCQGNGVGVRSVPGCNRMHQEWFGVRMAPG